MRPRARLGVHHRQCISYLKQRDISHCRGLPRPSRGTYEMSELAVRRVATQTGTMRYRASNSSARYCASRPPIQAWVRNTGVFIFLNLLRPGCIPHPLLIATDHAGDQRIAEPPDVTTATCTPAAAAKTIWRSYYVEHEAGSPQATVTEIRGKNL